MPIKLYDKIRQIIKDNFIFLFSLIIILLLFNFNLPCYIKAPGTLINVKNKVDISYELSGSYNMTYVTEYKPNIFNYVLAKLNKNWDIEKKDNTNLVHESESDSEKRGHILLEEGNQIAIINAYRMANKEINIKGSEIYVTYLDKNANTSLEVGDRILKIDGIEVLDVKDISDVINQKEYGSEITITTADGNKKATVINYDGNKKIGVSLSSIYQMDTEIHFKFKNNESGSSGGLMTTLYIYNSLIEEDLTRNRVIAGTGTIDISGNIGEIGGVKYKLIGAVKSKADIFFVPKENYEEALKVKKENDYDIDIVLVNTLEEAITYLKK